LTVDPSADGSSKSRAGVPSGTISEEAAISRSPENARVRRLPVPDGRFYAIGHGPPLHAGGPGGQAAAEAVPRRYFDWAPCLTLERGGDVRAVLETGYRDRGPGDPRLGSATCGIGRGAAPPRFGAS
jgi:hypothetical protein